jgi:serine/threonine protein kinase
VSLSPHSRLGPYEIVGALGAGGMGEVYRARDPRLGRDVAIKILPPAFRTDPERRLRFELFRTEIEPVTGSYVWHEYDISPDGRRFLVNSPEPQTSPITVITNWAELLSPYWPKVQ